MRKLYALVAVLSSRADRLRDPRGQAPGHPRRVQPGNMSPTKTKLDNGHRQERQRC